MILLLIACDAPAPPPVAPPGGDPHDPRSACAPYQADADAWGYCLATRVRGVGRDEVEAICTAAGAWASDCRNRWVAGELTRLGRRDTPGGLGVLVRDKALVAASDELIGVCRDDDCRFQAVDRWRDADLPNQLRRCLQAGMYTNECAFHAAQSWEEAKPAAEEALSTWSRLVGVDPAVRGWGEQAVGHVLACHEVPCPSEDPAGACRAAWDTAMARGCANALVPP